MRAPLGHEAIKTLAGELNRSLRKMIVLTADNDPFVADRGARLEHAQWFTEIWDRLIPPDGVHLRRLHYILMSTAALLPNGGPYTNTHRNWQFLGRASADARYLALVPIGAFDDRRSPPPCVHIPEQDEPASIWVQDHTPGDYLPLAFEPPAEPPVFVPTPFVPSQGTWFPALPRALFEQARIGQRYAVEIWVEKTTMNDVLIPLAKELDCTLVTGVGELSITQCHRQVERVIAHGRATRILYISDFDPAGKSMPVSVARKIEFLIRRNDVGVDVCLKPIVLTAEQVQQYRLPRVPIKDSDRRKTKFEQDNGEGAVELDALEALHPGELRRIVANEIERYRDDDIDDRVSEAAASIKRDLREIEAGVHRQHHDAIEAARADWQAVKQAIVEEQRAIHEHEQEIERLSIEHEHAIERHRWNIRRARDDWEQRATHVWKAIAHDLRAALPDPEEITWPEPENVDDDDVLFDSKRNYVEQLDRFLRHQGRRP